ncbi:MAG: hypothetical protein NE328_10925 [Lentisphaeraceae bacterium]|nr:hypothetical protein [Lentisphaeraceae bacterium]
MNMQETMHSKTSSGIENHCVIIDDRLYEVDVELLEKITKKLEAVTKPRRVKVRIFAGRHWSAKEVKLLGTDKDDVVAAKVGVSTSAVAAKRRELSIPPFRSPGNPSQRNWTEDEMAMLGKCTDSELASKLKISITTVGNKRRALGIRRYSKPDRLWTEEEIGLLGNIPDRILAKQLGVANHTVYFKRKSLGITAFNRTVHEDEKPREAPELNKSEKLLATQIYNIYLEAKTIVQAVARIKKFSKSQDSEKLKKVGSYLAAEYQDNFPFERCLTLVGIF